MKLQMLFMSDNAIGVMVILVMAAILAPLLYFFWWKPKKQGSSKHLNDGINWRKVPTGVCPTDDTVRQVTKLGISILSEKGKPQSILDQADEAYTYEKQRAMDEGNYTIFPEPSKIDIRFPKAGCVPSPEQRIPSFMIRGGRDYEAGEYDQHYDQKYDPPIVRDGRTLYSEPDDCCVIYCAELLTGLSTAGSVPGRDSAICCDGSFLEGTKNFLQHCFIAHNDGGYFAETYGAGHQHPIPYRTRALEQLFGLAGAEGVKMTGNSYTLNNSTFYTPVK